MKKIIAASVLLLAAACARDPFHGVVVAKTYEPSRTYTSTSLVCGKTCIPIVTVNTVPECFALAVKEDNGDTRSDCVDEDLWNSVEVNDRLDEPDKE